MWKTKFYAPRVTILTDMRQKKFYCIMNGDNNNIKTISTTAKMFLKVFLLIS